MKKAIMIGLVLLGNLPNLTYARCYQSNVVGDWYVKYQFRNPDQVGVCAVTFGQEGDMSGQCYRSGPENLSSALSGNSGHYAGL